MSSANRHSRSGDADDPLPVTVRGRRRDAVATRARILQAATEEFARYGLAGARGDRIAERARSSERMVYYYFGSKERLYRDVLDGVYLALRQAEHALRLDGLEPVTALSTFCRFVWRYYAEHPEFVGLVSAENLHQAQHLRLSSHLDELVSPVVAMLDALLRRGARQRVFRAGIDATQLYVAIAGLGYFPLSNTHTLSAVLGRPLRDPGHLQAHWEAAEAMILGFVRDGAAVATDIRQPGPETDREALLHRAAPRQRGQRSG